MTCTAVWDRILLLLGAPACELQLTYDLALEARRFVCPELYMRMEPGKDDGRRLVGARSLGSFATIFSSVLSIESSLAFLLMFTPSLYILVRRNLSSTEIEKQKELHRLVNSLYWYSSLEVVMVHDYRSNRGTTKRCKNFEL